MSTVASGPAGAGGSRPAIDRYLAADNTGENYSSAVRCEGLLFVAGQLGAEPGGDPVPFGEQVRRALQSVIAVVEACGGTRETLLKVNAFIGDVKYFPQFHQTYREVMGGAPRPARTTVQVGGFLSPVLVEIDAVAAVLDTE